MRVKAVEKDTWRVLLACLSGENRRVCLVALQTGLRVSDVLALKTCDLRQKMSIKEIKTGKVRKVELDDDVLTELRATAGEVYVFPHRYDINRPRTRQSVWKDLKRSARALGLGGRDGHGIGTHSCRKSYARDMYNKSGGNVKAVQSDFKHADLLCTTIYALADELSIRNA